MPARVGPQTSLTGTVTDVSGDTISFTTSLLLDEAVDGVGDERKAVVTGDTTVVVMERLSDEVFAQLQQTFFTQLQNRGANDMPPLPPSQYREVTGSLSDIAPGDMITVMGTEGEDLSLVEKVAATRVIVMKVAAAE
jgi:hypothetical protein